jgi:hypothetical protein
MVCFQSSRDLIVAAEFAQGVRNLQPVHDQVDLCEVAILCKPICPSTLMDLLHLGHEVVEVP